jgi:AcrR family transcriptional regulator
LTLVQPASDRDDERRSIIDAACRCLLEPHSGPVPMSAILSSAGLSSRAFYRHFVSKDGLFLALLQQACGALVANVDRVADAAVGTPSEQLADWIGEMFDAILDPNQLRQLAVIDSDEVRAAKGYRHMRERLHARWPRSCAVASPTARFRWPIRDSTPPPSMRSSAGWWPSRTPRTSRRSRTRRRGRSISPGVPSAR